MLKKQKVKKQCKSRSQCSKKVVNYDHEVQWHYDVQKKNSPTTFRGGVELMAKASRPNEVMRSQIIGIWLGVCQLVGGKRRWEVVDNGKCMRARDLLYQSNSHILVKQKL